MLYLRCVFSGGPLYGVLESGKEADLMDDRPEIDITTLKDQCKAENEQLLRNLKVDPHEAELMKLTLEDAQKGRMSYPVAGVFYTYYVLLILSAKCASHVHFVLSS